MCIITLPKRNHWILGSRGKEWWFETSLSVIFSGFDFYAFIVSKRCTAILRSMQ